MRFVYRVLSFATETMSESRLHCDNKSMVASSQEVPAEWKRTPNSTQASDYDVLAELWATRDLLSATTARSCPAVLHIKGHQDKKIAYELLSLPAQLNVDADKLAGDYMAAHPDKDYTVVPILPTSGVQLHLSAGTITYNMKKEVSMTRTTEPMKQYMIKKHGWEEDTFLDIEWEAHKRAANRHHKQRATLNKHLGNFLPVGKVVSRCDPLKCRSDCPTCSIGDGTCLETCSHVYRCPARSDWTKKFMSGLCKKLDSLETEIDLTEMVLAGVNCALTRQPFRVPQELRNLAAAQQAIGWTHLFKGRISKQLILLGH